MRFILLACTLVIAAVPAGAAYVPQATAAPGSVPQGVNYQGRLEDNGFPVTGARQMLFRLYDAASGGNLLWTSAPQTASVSMGLFSVVAPVPVAALAGGGARHLEVEIGGTTMSPREPLNAVPYALIAKTVEGTIDISTSAFTIVSNGAAAALYVSSVNARVGVGTQSPGAQFDVEGDAQFGAGAAKSTFTAAGALALANLGAPPAARRGMLFFDPAGVGAVKISLDGASFVSLATGSVSGGFVVKAGDAMTGNLFVSGSTLTVNGPLISTGTSGGVVFTGAGTRFEWIPSSAAIRAGAVSAAQWDPASIGLYSAAFGSDSTASGLYSTVGGGSGNTASGRSSMVGGGNFNAASGRESATGGGLDNAASGNASTVSGGYSNTAGGYYSVVGGGYDNTASGDNSTVSGGSYNTASGNDSTVGGGYSNAASGSLSFAAGNRARATARGSFVWADSQNADLTGATTDQFLVRARGGFEARTSSVGVISPTAGTLFTLDASSAQFKVPLYDQSGNLLASGGSFVSKLGDAMTGNLFVGGSTLTVNGPLISTGTSGGVVFTGAGTRFEWIPSSAAIRAGAVSGTEWDPANIGAYSVAFGRANRASNSDAVVGGGNDNTASGAYSTVSGGAFNRASGGGAAVGGGESNTASGSISTVGGGASNVASQIFSTVGGGDDNTAGNNAATVGGGYGNTASGLRSTVGGGDTNTASGSFSIVPGGTNNLAAGPYSFAAGRRAKAAAQGSLVWADSQDADLTGNTTDQFLVRARGGFQTNTSSISVVGTTQTLFTVDGSSAHFMVPLAVTGSSNGPLTNHDGVILASSLQGSGEHTTSGAGGGVVITRTDTNSFGTGINDLIYMSGYNSNGDITANNGGQSGSLLLFGHAGSLRNMGDDRGLVEIAGKTDGYCITSGGGVGIYGDCGDSVYLNHSGGSGKGYLIGDVGGVYTDNEAGGGYFAGIGRANDLNANYGADNPLSPGTVMAVGKVTGNVATSAGEFLVVSTMTGAGSITTVGTGSLMIGGNGGRARLAAGHGYGGASRGAQSIYLDFRDFEPLERMAAGQGLKVSSATAVTGGWGTAAAATPSQVVIGGGGSSPEAGSITFGDGTGWKLKFATTSGGAFTPLLTVSDLGTVTVGAGGNTIFRCATAGALPVGTLTVNAASCGTTADTGLRVP